MNNEPVAWMSADGKFNKKETWIFHIPLFTHPAKTLTDEEIKALWKPLPDTKYYDSDILNFARAILRKASEK